ncbi:MAG: GNAT family N-acetyltransferase, partial [Cyclobacteriaceae bacterium]|nr:GNAT family N-acetyltransferase [Cyclobacteriaceae bacterium]
MYTVRKGKIKDLPRVLELIKELAIYEKAPEQVTNTVEMMEKDGFGPQPVFGLFVCEKNETSEIIGIAIYYYRY